MNTAPTHLADVFVRAARLRPDRGISVFDARGRNAERRTWPEVLAGARSAAGRLAGVGLAPGEPLLISLTTSWDLLEAWLGAIFLGAHPVVTAPVAGLGGSQSQMRRLEAAAVRLGARRVLAQGSFAAEASAADCPTLAAAAFSPETLAGAAQAAWEPLQPDPADLAFMQLTSGSTGAPRAVMIPHRAALHNGPSSSRAIGAPHGAPAHEWADALVSWLPLHHDMGLVGGLIFSAHCALDLYLLHPRTFLARPLLWLQELGRRGKTIAAAPNFAYQACVDRVGPQDLEGLDLSGWRTALTGAEMVRVPTAEAFIERFGAAGFQRSQLRPCYGLAEGTLAVTFDVEGRGPHTLPMPEWAGKDAGNARAVNEVVSVGRPIDGLTVLAKSPDGAALPEGRVGEICVFGPSVFAGYCGDRQATAEGLRSGWLHTGDLGFIQGGELYLTGRVKDVLIVRGQNLMPHELEWTVEAVTGGGGAKRAGAFSITRGDAGEEAIVVAEVEGLEPAVLTVLEREVRVSVGREHGLTLADVVFLRRGRIPKTTSGKVRRLELRRQYLAGELERLTPQ